MQRMEIVVESGANCQVGCRVKAAMTVLVDANNRGPKVKPCGTPVV